MTPQRPTAAQAKVLKSIQNSTRARLEASEGAERDLLRRELVFAGIAGGVPRAWIAHVLERGHRGIEWRSDLYLRDPEPVDRAALLDALERDIGQIHEVVSVVARHSAAASTVSARTVSLVQRRVQVMWDRAVTLTHLLGVAAEDAAHLWGTNRQWAAEAADAVARMPPGAIAERLHGWVALDPDMKRIGLQATALRAAGLTPHAARHVPPTPAQMVGEVKSALADRNSAAELAAQAAPGWVIEHAVAVAGLDEPTSSATDITASDPTFVAAATPVFSVEADTNRGAGL
ncbi:hypothetical protein IU500_18575 [Nocardia terpenica]|uniref:hypothetical protein n=1 Tax=Nocardia terpenica TaxID=455432 RepID=UPI001895CC05|nr:hypothetical protein [Nocardia terpenica]MBF6063492.1 hypothetical protein [Nocardia terpenica]MBF6106048.1 hypothetical protein [Nocardia terpenica]MBF6113367.1 hypothetical protein [Nocardia terpenica]MBF6119789.1 hypothetical protein [Nocardia terpenica]MBF6152200.1 hypothetical protein [Nocardia terpenica]